MGPQNFSTGVPGEQTGASSSSARTPPPPSLAKSQGDVLPQLDTPPFIYLPLHGAVHSVDGVAANDTGGGGRERMEQAPHNGKGEGRSELQCSLSAGLCQLKSDRVTASRERTQPTQTQTPKGNQVAGREGHRKPETKSEVSQSDSCRNTYHAMRQLVLKSVCFGRGRISELR